MTTKYTRHSAIGRHSGASCLWYLFWVFTFGCADASRESKSVVEPYQVIREAGNYVIEGGALALTVSVSGGLVVFSTVDVQGRIKFSYGDSASAYSRWFIMWDDEVRLWFFSSDVGGKCYLPDENGDYKSLGLEEAKNARIAIPKPFVENVPTSIRSTFDDWPRQGE